jgi:glycosyltransferase involved in cell wall biosynthesis
MMADAYKPKVSGVTSYITLSKRWLEKAGHEVFVFTFGEEDYVDDEPNIIRSPGLPLVDTGFYISLHYSRPARQLLYTMDLVHVHHPFISGTLALTYAIPRNIPVVFTNHSRYDLLTNAYLPILPDSFGETAMRAYLPPFCQACDMVIAPSRSMSAILQDFGVDVPIEVIPNGVELDAIRTCATLTDRATMGFSPDHVVFTYIGRLAPEKNLNVLLRAFRGVASAYGNARLLLVGDGPERENLEDSATNMGIADKVHFTGMVPFDQVPCYLATADAFVIASTSETFGLSLVEAMAAGLPVLGIDSPGIRDIIEDGKTGFLSQDDVASFTAKMARLASEHELRIQMGAEAKKASAAYDIKLTTQTMIDCYQQLINNRSYRKNSLRYRINRALDYWR